VRALTLVLVSVLPAATAHAEDDVFIFGAGHLGLNLPVGAVGGELGVGLDWMRASASVGRGFRGVSMAAMVRVRQFSGMDIGLGVGVSRGRVFTIRTSVSARVIRRTRPDTHFGKDTRWLDSVVQFAIPGPRLHAPHRRHDTRCIDESEDKEIGATVCDPSQRNELERSSHSPYVKRGRPPVSRHLREAATAIPVGPQRHPIFVDRCASP
jgi:hypothetical protein